MINLLDVIIEVFVFNLLMLFLRKSFWLILFCLPVVVKAQVDCIQLFIKEYHDGARDLEPYAIKSMADGSYIVAGRTKAKTDNQYDGIVMKLSPKGAIDWTFITGGLDEDKFSGILALKNGDFLLYGSSSSFGSTNEKVWMVRVSGSGSLIWSKILGSEITGADRIKAMLELPDSNLVGTFNSKDSSSQSDPVIFKMSKDGTLQWSHIFDDGDNDSFTSLSFNKDTIYAGGFYTGTSKRGVIVKVNSNNGSLLSSSTIYRNDDSYEEEIKGVEAYDNIISYGLDIYHGVTQDGIILKQTDLNGNILYERYAINTLDPDILTIRRTRDSGFLILRNKGSGETPNLFKFSRYGLMDWGTKLCPYYLPQVNYALDTTADGGCISAGFYSSYFTGYKNIVNVIKMNSELYAGECTPMWVGMFSDTGTCKEVPYTWKKEQAYTLLIDAFVVPSITPYLPKIDNLCDSSLCTDKTPLPEGCGKTFRMEYATDKSTLFRDVISTDDGGKIAIGDIQEDALLVKFKTNADIEWAKSYEEFAHNMKFMRILKTGDNNLMVFGNHYITVDHGVAQMVAMIKMDNNGNVLWTKNLSKYSDGEMVDAVEAPDGGPIVTINEGYGLGYIYSFVIHFDVDGNIIWQKELQHAVAVPLYRSITCSDSAVYIAFDSYDSYGYPRFGVDKLDLKTGNQVWSKRYLTEAGNVERINRLCCIGDSAYVFINNQATGPFDYVEALRLVKLDPEGNIYETFSLSPGKILTVNPYYYSWDASPPTVTMTPSFDFVVASRIVSGTDTVLNISRFLRNGDKVWSRNYPGMKSYTPLNIHSQGDGFIVAGTLPTINPIIKNAFLLKTDSSGFVIPGTSGDCSEKDGILKKGNFSTSISNSAIDAVVNLTGLSVTFTPVLNQSAVLDAVPFCSVLGNCGTVGFKQKGNGCSLDDTLTYYLENPENCNAAATWQYDPLFFKAVSVNGKAIELIPLKNGVSTITARIEGNCSYTEKKLTASILLSASEMSLGEDTLICKNGNIRLDAGPGYKNYKWQDGSTDSVFNAVTPGRYFVTVSDNCGGMSTDTILVEDAGLLFNVSDDKIKCNDEHVLLEASSGYNNYQWSPMSYIQPNGDSATVYPASTTKYYVQAEKWPGCVVKDSVLVTAVTTSDINLGNDTSFCTGQSILLDAGTGFGSYVWNTGSASQKLTVSTVGTFIVSAFKDGCTETDTLKVISVSPPPVFTLGNDTALCSQEKLNYNYNISNATYAWSDGSSSKNYEIGGPGKYWLTTTQNGCSASDTILVTSKPSPLVNLGDDSTLCSEATTLLTAYNYGATYYWQDGSITSDYLVKKDGEYFVAVSKDNCVTKDTINISYQPPLYFSLGEDELLCNGAELKLDPKINSATSYLWQDGSTAPVFIVTKEGTYTLTATDKCGSFTDSINVSSNICQLQMPNAFTPNKDGNNDVFRVKNPFPVKQFNMTIFNRWGEKIFESSDIYHGWDGRNKGIDVISDTFIWVIAFTDIQGKKQNAHGTVTLLR